MLKMLSNASYTFPAMQDATTLLHSQSYASYGELKEKPQGHAQQYQHHQHSLSQSHSFSHSSSTTDEEMTSASGDSDGDSFGDTDTTPETSLGEEEKIQEDKVVEDNDDAVSNKPVVEDEAMEEDRKGDEAERNELDLQPKLSEWERQGGMMDINAAFEGTMIFDATLEEISAWCAPLVWKLFLRQEPACSKSSLHRYHISLDTPMPPTLPKLLTKAMPRYKGGMTRSIAVTHALLYLHRINVCFHCNGASRDAIANSNSSNGNSNSNGNGNTNPKGTPGKTGDLRSRIERNFQSTGEENRVSDNAFQCSLFFAVGMHFASLWLLDCCPADIKYWKNYVHCVPATHGIPWFRLVLRQWGYNITVSIDEWLFFSAQVLSKVPFRDEETRARQQQLGQ